MTRRSECENCHGKGYTTFGTCAHCGGKGWCDRGGLCCDKQGRDERDARRTVEQERDRAQEAERRHRKKATPSAGGGGSWVWFGLAGGVALLVAASAAYAWASSALDDFSRSTTGSVSASMWVVVLAGPVFAFLTVVILVINIWRPFTVPAAIRLGGSLSVFVYVMAGCGAAISYFAWRAGITDQGLGKEVMLYSVLLIGALVIAVVAAMRHTGPDGPLPARRQPPIQI